MSDEIIFRSPYPPIEIPEISSGEYFYKKLKNYKDRLILIENKSGVSLTANQLISKANNLAVALLKRGITKTDIVCCHSDNKIEYAILVFAIHFLGLTLTNSKPKNNIFELENQVRDSGATVIFTSLANAPISEKLLQRANAPYIKYVFVFDGNYGAFNSFDQLFNECTNEKLDRIPHFPINPQKDMCVISYTSGTTGLPKGAILSHYAFLAALETFLRLDIEPTENVVSNHFPFGHISGTLFGPMWISRGITVILHDTTDEETILASVAKYKVTLLPLFQTFGHKLIEGPLVGKYDLSSLKIMIHGGTYFPANIARTIIDKYNVQFVECYGMTECMGVTHNPDNLFIPGNCGYVAPNVQIKIVDLSKGNSLNKNQTGEICVRGPSMFLGYLNNEEATNQAIDSEGWFHTGDVGHFDDNGRLFITDRIKELIKFRIWSVSPAEIEESLVRHEAILEAAVIGKPDKVDSQLPMAFVKLKPGFKVSKEEIQKFVSDNMAYQNQLRGGIEFVDQIPRTIVGKVDRQYFKKLLEEKTANINK